MSDQPNRTVMGIDADVRGISYAVRHSDARTWTIGSVRRTNHNNEPAPNYAENIRALFEHAKAFTAAVFLEDIFLAEQRGRATARNVKVFRALAEIQGELRFIAGEYGLMLQPVLASEWQWPILGIGRDREQLKAAAHAVAFTMIGRHLDEHEADAVCIAKYGATVVA